MTAIYVEDARENGDNGRQRRGLTNSTTIDKVINVYRNHDLEHRLGGLVHSWDTDIKAFLESKSGIARRVEHRDGQKHAK